MEVVNEADKIVRSVLSIWIDREMTIRKLKCSAARVRLRGPEIRKTKWIGSPARDAHTATSDAEGLLILKQGGETR